MQIRTLNYPKQKKTILEQFTPDYSRNKRVEKIVARIIEAVAKHGDKALSEFTEQFDGVKLTRKNFRLSPSKLRTAWQGIPGELKRALQLAKERIGRFHKRQLPRSWSIKEKSGLKLSYRYGPLRRVGVYVPGGLAAYPSTVLMNIIPAQVAGVKEIVMATPPIKDGKGPQATLAAAYLLGVTEVYQIGGAQAIAALALGTATIPKVDKIVGPGNIYVAEAQRQLFGTVDIEMVAGPSEIMIIADKTAPAKFVAADLLSQAEHDPYAVAMAILISPYPETELIKEINSQLKRAARRSVIRQALRNNGLIIKVKTPQQAIELANLRSPEHLEIMTRSPQQLANKVVNAGAIFLDRYSPEPLGDYIVGPNHTLPTGGTARFFSPLSVASFLKATNIIEATRQALAELGPSAITLADCEGLEAHSQAIKIRHL